jgi:hypothetical protein
MSQAPAPRIAHCTARAMASSRCRPKRGNEPILVAIHVDPERAATGPDGSVAHGYLTPSHIVPLLTLIRWLRWPRRIRNVRLRSTTNSESGVMRVRVWQTRSGT